MTVLWLFSYRFQCQGCWGMAVSFSSSYENLTLLDYNCTIFLAYFIYSWEEKMQNSPERCLLCFPVLSALPENLTDLRNISCIDQRPLVGIKYFTLIHSFLQRSSASVLIFPLINLSLIISSFSQIMERPFFFNFFFISLKMTDFSMKMPLVTLPVRVPIPP